MNGINANVLQFLAGFVLGAVVMLGVSMYIDVPMLTGFENEDVKAISDKKEGEAENEQGATSSPAITGSGNVVFGALPEETSADVSVLPQPAGSSVSIASVTMPESGWIVVHEIIDGHVANALGATRHDAGEYSNVVVELLRDTIPNAAYVVVLYSDNGNGLFELSSDLPIVDDFGDALIQEFKTE